MVDCSAPDPRALLALANLYSQQLHENPKARQYYQQLLAADPHNPEADAIRYWLAGHP